VDELGGESEPVSEEEVAAPAPSGSSLVSLKLSFKIFEKPSDPNAKLSDIEPGSDKALDGLLSGKIDTTTLSKFQKEITSTAFIPVKFDSAWSLGKQDLFE
jgi:hypothetical protein